jgi:hypothetical protein
MALLACKECGKEISRSAPTCPNCGHKPRRTSAFTWIIAFFLGPGVVGAIFGGASNTPPGAVQQTPEARCNEAPG